jgi:hypothetical protein
MATCYLCGLDLPKGQGQRKLVYTGFSIGGLDLSSIALLSWLLNSLVKRRAASIRSYYSLKTVCDSCAARIDLAEKRKLVGGLVIAVGLAGIVLLFLFVPHP